MRKSLVFLLCTLGLVACDKHDPILPGERSNIFNTKTLNILNTPVENAPENVDIATVADCPYTQKSDNTIWDDGRKIFSGFATGNSVAGTRTPVCEDGFVYAGLSTGELVKVNPRNRQIVWVADIYRQSNMTGGASVLDIVAPIMIRGKYVYAGGLGDAFCKISVATGNAAWCVDIGVEKPFIITDTVAYVVDTENMIDAVRLRDGAIHWRAAVKKSRTPKYQNKTIIVGDEKFNAETGEKISG